MNNTLVMIIKDTVTPNFMNIRTSLHVYEEPAFHEEGMDNPDNPTSVILSDEQLLDYLDSVEQKTMAYLDSLTDDMLAEKPENCPYTRLELVLRQYRHLSFHTGMLNGQTALATGQFPMWVSEKGQYVDDGIFFGRYRKYQVKA